MEKNPSVWGLWKFAPFLHTVLETEHLHGEASKKREITQMVSRAPQAQH